MADDGYLFVKGKSRASGSQSDSDDAPKRKKTDATQRAREMKVLQANIVTLESRMQFKKQMLEKARSVNNFKLCDDISGDIINVRKEKRIAEKQLEALQKTQAKSQWYHKRKLMKTGEVDSAKKIGETGTVSILGHFSKSSLGNQDQGTVPNLRHSNSTGSSASDDTLILSDSNEDLDPDATEDQPAAVAKEQNFY